MKRICVLLLSVLMLAMLLTGCVSTDIGVRLDKNGTGAVTATLGIEEEFYHNLCSAGSDPFEGKITSSLEKDGKTYIACAETTEYDSYKEIETALLDMTYDTELYENAAPDETVDEPVLPDQQDNHIFKKVSIEKNGGLFYSTYHFSATLNPVKKEADGYQANDLFSLSMSVEMPAKITQVQGGAAEDNRVTFDIKDITAETDYAVSSEVNHYGVVIGIAVTLAAVLVAFLIYTRRKG